MLHSLPTSSRWLQGVRTGSRAGYSGLALKTCLDSLSGARLHSVYLVLWPFEPHLQRPGLKVTEFIELFADSLLIVANPLKTVLHDVGNINLDGGGTTSIESSEPAI